MFKLTEKSIDTEELMKLLKNDGAGALVTFEGRVRNKNEGKSVSKLFYEAYEGLAAKEADRILEEARLKFPILEVASIHRVGELAIGEISVWVGVSSPHRREAFSACQYIIDEIKHRLPIWKKETYSDGSYEWVNCQGCHSHSHRHAHAGTKEEAVKKR